MLRELLDLKASLACRPALALISTALLVGVVVARGAAPDDFWADAELAEGEAQGIEALCDTSFLQTSLGTQPRLSAAEPAKAAASHRGPAEPSLHQKKDENEREVLHAGLSLFQVDEEIAVNSETVVTDVTDIVAKEGSAKEAAEEAPSEDAHERESLRWLVLAIKLLTATVITLKGGSTFVRLLVRHRGKISSEVMPPECVKPSCEEPTEVTFIPLATAQEVEALLPAADGGYDCAFGRPQSVGRPLRFRVRLHQLVPGPEPLTTPLTEEACVLHHVTVKRRAKDSPHQWSTLIDRVESVDFLATLEDAPSVGMVLRGNEVRMCDMCTSRKAELMRVGAAPHSWQTLAREVEGTCDEEELYFEEEALRVGEVVTLVGDLHRDATGALLLFPASRFSEGIPRDSPAAKDAAAYFDDVHVLASDDPCFLATVPCSEASYAEDDGLILP
eukprot:TRINITY_DN17479_c0_g1_i2.p1 TRINITY_DN17479_c0_g1~~TRINITY_DN17479_c0_g1_i2.p1  ORF type:complete len:447 (-),score=111.16 TRINITY_DN17479_c0_g1_i2:37-1377(-)